MVIEKVVGPAGSVPLEGRRIERIVLPSGDLAKHRQRARTDAGREVGIALPHGSHLHDGDVVHLDPTTAIVVEQADEELLRYLPRSPEEFGAIAYQVGNLHRAAMIDAQGVTVLHEPAMEALGERAGVRWERRRGKFRPLQGSGHKH